MVVVMTAVVFMVLGYWYEAEARDKIKTMIAAGLLGILLGFLISLLMNQSAYH